MADGGLRWCARKSSCIGISLRYWNCKLKIDQMPLVQSVQRPWSLPVQKIYVFMVWRMQHCTLCFYWRLNITLYIKLDTPCNFLFLVLVSEVDSQANLCIESKPWEFCSLADCVVPCCSATGHKQGQVVFHLPQCSAAFTILPPRFSVQIQF